MQLVKGARLGPYEILSPIGAGGMGEVYRARDVRLGRAVAIKVIALSALHDPKNHARFEREARAISALSHPHICALYDIGEMPGENAKADPVRYIVMEYLEGETLEQRLKRGPLPIEMVLRYGIDIADSLDGAHRSHIVHRDLKPSNIMLTKTGARLFDFGLAKFIQPASDASMIRSSTVTQPRTVTAEGSIIGTLEYMAPEQVKGEEPDARTDIFAFGVCLYQMITGRRPFEATSRAAVIAAILEAQPPDISKYRPDSPTRLQWLVRNCIAKDPNERLQTTHDIKLQLQQIADEARTNETPQRLPTPVRRIVAYSAVGVGVVLAAIAVGFLRHLPAATPRKLSPKHFTISLNANAPIASGIFEKLAVSADGTKLAYVGEANGLTHLYLYSLDTSQTTLLPHTDGARSPFFSPDGQSLGFYNAAREINKLDLTQLSPTLLASNRDLRGATWGPKNTIIFAEPRSPLRAISATPDATMENVTPYDPNAEIRWPTFLPDGDTVLYTSSDFRGDYDNARLLATNIKTGRTKVVLNQATCGRYVGAGYLAYFHSQTLFLVPFDAQRVATTGAPVPIASDIEYFFSSGLPEFAASSEGSLFYVPAPSEVQGQLVWVDRAGNTTALTRSHGAYDNPKLSPDGTTVLVRVGAPPRSDIWTYNILRSAWTRLTTEATNLSPIWSADGTHIAFSSNLTRGFELYTMPSDGSAPAKQITAWRSWDFPTSWSPDGSAIAVEEQYRATLADVYVVTPTPGSRPVPFVATRFSENEAVFSPDGHWIAYQSNESGRPEIYVQPYPATGRKWSVSTGGAALPVWRRDGKELFFRSGNAMMSVAVHADHGFDAGKPQLLFRGDFSPFYDVSTDGNRFLMVKLPKTAPLTQIHAVVGLSGK